MGSSSAIPTSREVEVEAAPAEEVAVVVEAADVAAAVVDVPAADTSPEPHPVR